jgi:hypothetical protein
MTEEVKNTQDQRDVVACPRCLGEGVDPDVEATPHCCQEAPECGTGQCEGPRMEPNFVACELCTGFKELPRDTALAYALEV